MRINRLLRRFVSRSGPRAGIRRKNSAARHRSQRYKHFDVPFDQLSASHMPFAKTSNAPRLFFRTLAPAHGGFSQKINSGSVSLDFFDPNQLGTLW